MASFWNLTWQELSSRPQRPDFFLHAPVPLGKNACWVAKWRDRGEIKPSPTPMKSTTHLVAHSYKLRIAITGSTLVARRAGTKHAASATPHNNSEIKTNVIGSVALTP